MGFTNLRMPLDIQKFTGSLSLSNVYETRVDVGSNTSYVHATLTLSVSSGTYNQTGSAYYYVNMSGQNNSYGTGNQTIYVSKGFSGVIWDGELGPFSHNSDGSLNAVSISAYAYVVSNTQPTASSSCNMSTIPRAPSYNSISASSITETSVRLTASIDTKGLSITGGGWDLSTDGGITWTYYANDPTGKTITGLIADKDYWYRGYCTTSGGGNNSSWQRFKTVAYPSVKTSQTFTIGQSFTLQFNNPLGRTLTITGIGADNSTIFSGSTSGTSLTGFNDSTSIANQYASIPNSKKGTYKIRLVVSALGRDTTVTGSEYYVNEDVCKPTFSAYTFADVNPVTVALTGNNKYLVNGHSTIRATISTSNKAVANNSATMKNYTMLLNSGTVSFPYSSSETVYGELPNAKSIGGSLSVYANDSRGISTTKSYTFTKTIFYEEPTKDINNSSVKRVNSSLQEQGDSEKVLLTLNGSIWYSPSGITGDFGQARNSITSATYKYKTSSTSWSNPTSILNDVTLNSDGTFEFEGLIQGDTADGFGKTNVYTIEVTVADAVSSAVYTFILQAGKPLISYSRNGIGIMCAYDETLGGPLQVDGKKIGIDYYKTTEIVVGEWIDGKTIYRKVIEAGSLPNATTKTINLNMSNISVVRMYGISKKSGSTVPMPEQNIRITINTMNNNQYNYLYIVTTDDRSSYTGYVVLEYTKTTD